MCSFSQILRLQNILQPCCCRQLEGTKTALQQWNRDKERPKIVSQFGSMLGRMDYKIDVDKMRYSGLRQSGGSRFEILENSNGCFHIQKNVEAKVETNKVCLIIGEMHVSIPRVGSMKIFTRI